MLGYKKGNTKLLTGQIPLHYPGDRVYLDGDPTKSVQDKVARKADLTNLDLTGTTNTTGSTITGGTYFYLNGTLVRAKTAIASGATFTLNTNYEEVTAGGLNEVVNKSGGTMTGDLTLGKQGTILKIRAGGSRYTNITSSASGADSSIVLPNASGTVALTSEVPQHIDMLSVPKNGSVTAVIPNFSSGRGYLIIISSGNAYEWHWFGYYLSSPQLPQLVRLDSGGSLSVSVDGNTLTISNSNGSYVAYVNITIVQKEEQINEILCNLCFKRSFAGR